MFAALQGMQQLFVDSAKVTVAHYQDMVAAACLLHHRCNNLID